MTTEWGIIPTITPSMKAFAIGMGVVLILGLIVGIKLWWNARQEANTYKPEVKQDSQ